MYDLNIKWISVHTIALERSVILEKADFNYILLYRDLELKVKVMKSNSGHLQVLDEYVCQISSKNTL